MPEPEAAPDRAAELKAAFAAFATVSGELEAGYAALRRQVESLEARLADAQRERLAEAERKAELAQRLAALLEALPGGVVMLDAEGIVRELNGTAAAYLGEPLQDTAWTTVRSRAFAGRHESEGDLTLQDGRRLSVAQRPVEPGPGRVLLFTDVTEHRKVQELLNRHRRLAALGEMAAALAHQVRTPLSAALLYTSSAARPGMDADRRGQLLDKAMRCLHELEGLVGDMLRFARGARLSEARVPVNEILESVRVAQEPLVGPRQRLEIEAAAGPVAVRGNRESIASALGNLVANALHHAGELAVVRVEARPAGIDLELRVSDNGPGIADEDRERIFEPFFTTRPDGTGLGLAVVRSIAQAHGGDVRLEPGGQGASFVVRLPADRAGDVEAAA